MSEPVTLWPTQVGVWDSRQGIVMIHRKECRMSNIAWPKSHVTTLPHQRDIDDMVARGYKVLHCRCCKNV